MWSAIVSLPVESSVTAIAGDLDVGDAVVLEQEVELLVVDLEVNAGDRVRGRAVRRDLERVDRAEVLGDLAELVADVEDARDEVGRDVEQPIVQIACDEALRALDDVLERAVRELR